MSAEKLKKALKEKKLSLGENSTLRNIRNGKVAVVFMATDIKPTLKETIKEFSEHSGFELVEVELDAHEVGILCKKQFPIAILSY